MLLTASSYPPPPLLNHAENQENNGQTGSRAKTRQCPSEEKEWSEKRRSDESPCLDKQCLHKGEVQRTTLMKMFLRTTWAAHDVGGRGGPFAKPSPPLMLLVALPTY